MARQTTDVRVVAAGLDQRGIGAGGTAHAARVVAAARGKRQALWWRLDRPGAHREYTKSVAPN